MSSNWRPMPPGFLPGLSAAALLLSWPACAQLEPPAVGSPGHETSAATSAGMFAASDWSLTLRAYGGYDDNVPLVPDAPPYWDARARKGSGFAAVAANVAVRVPVARATVIGAAARFDHVRYLAHQPDLGAGFTEQDDPADYSLTAVTATAFVEQRFGGGGVGASYSFHREGAKIEAIGLDRHSVSAYASLRAARGTTLRASGSYSGNDYSVDFRPNKARDRDGELLAIDFSIAQKLTARQTLTLGAGYIRNRAGRDWAYHGWRVSGVFVTHVAGPVYARASAAYTDTPRNGGFTDSVPGPGMKYRRLLDLGATASWSLGPKLVLDVSYRRQRWTANLPQFEGTRQRISAGVTWSL